MPEHYNLPYTFYSLSPSLRYYYKFTAQKSFNINVSSNIENMSVEQLRDVIIDTNPMFLTVGNPHLKQPVTTNGSINLYNSVAAKNMSILLSVSGLYTHDYIATKTLYFSEATKLEEYNYTAAAGSSLTSYENAGGYYNISTNMSLDKRLNDLGATLKAELSYSYAHIPFFLQTEARTTSQHQVTANINLTAGFSEHFKPELNSSTRAGIFTSGPYGSSRYIEEQLSGVIRLNFAKRYLANTMATYNMYRNDKSSQSDRDDVYWNCEVGRTFGKNNQLKFMAGVVDLLNRSANRVVTIQNDYITTQSSSILGRYWFVNASYMF